MGDDTNTEDPPRIFHVVVTLTGDSYGGIPTQPLSPTETLAK
jgi:hypothetical protein